MTQGKHAIVGLVSGSHLSELTPPSGETDSQLPGDQRVRPEKVAEKSTKDQKNRSQAKKPDQKRT
jgi:hypothetical protein